ncbi:hypothetical protein HPB47_004462, partial [Ixodes persulcatus]
VASAVLTVLLLGFPAAPIFGPTQEDFETNGYPMLMLPPLTVSSASPSATESTQFYGWQHRLRHVRLGGRMGVLGGLQKRGNFFRQFGHDTELRMPYSSHFVPQRSWLKLTDARYVTSFNSAVRTGDEVAGLPSSWISSHTSQFWCSFWHWPWCLLEKATAVTAVITEGTVVEAMAMGVATEDTDTEDLSDTEDITATTEATVMEEDTAKGATATDMDTVVIAVMADTADMVTVDTMGGAASGEWERSAVPDLRSLLQLLTSQRLREVGEGPPPRVSFQPPSRAFHVPRAPRATRPSRNMEPALGAAGPRLAWSEARPGPRVRLAESLDSARPNKPPSAGALGNSYSSAPGLAAPRLDVLH